MYKRNTSNHLSDSNNEQSLISDQKDFFNLSRRSKMEDNEDKGQPTVVSSEEPASVMNPSTALKDL